MQLSLPAEILWATGFAELVALMLVLVIRRRVPVFPFFTAYVGFQLLEAVALYAIHRFGSHDAYFWAFWIGAMIDLSLQISVVFELARIVLKPTGTWVRDARRVFLLLASAGALVAAASAYGVNPTIPNTLDNWIEKGNLFAAMLNAQLFIAMGLASTRLGLAWRNHVMGIAAGWAFWAAVGLFVEAAYSYFGPDWHGVVLDYVRILAYQAATIYWIINLWLPEPKARKMTSDMQSRLSELQKHLSLGIHGAGTLDRH